jgi:hypothetical protein
MIIKVYGSIKAIVLYFEQVFKTWCLRHTQKKEVERRYEDTWHNYLVTILQSWQQWAHGMFC